jgi:hypothetical protein
MRYGNYAIETSSGCDDCNCTLQIIAGSILLGSTDNEIIAGLEACSTQLWVLAIEICNLIAKFRAVICYLTRRWNNNYAITMCTILSANRHKTTKFMNSKQTKMPKTEQD